MRKIKTPSSIEGDYISRPLCIPNNRDWLGAFTGVLEWLTQAYNWQQLNETDLTPEQAAAAAQNILNDYFANQGECGEVATCCGQGTRTRVNDADRVEVSTDGGVTWTVNDAYDPRSIATLFRKIDTGLGADADACAAASNFRTNMEEAIENLKFALTTYTGATAIAANFAPAVAAYVGVPVAGAAVGITVFVTTLVGVALGFGIALITDAFDAPLYEWLKCDYYCRIGNEDPTWEMIDAMIVAVFEEYGIATPENATKVGLTAAFLKVMGPIGMANLARSGGGGTDCEGCDCPNPFCHLWVLPPTGAIDDWVLMVGTISGEGYWIGETDGPVDRLFARLTFDFGVSEVTLIEADFANPFGTISRILVDDVIIYDGGAVASGWHAAAGSWTGAHVVDVYLDGPIGSPQMVMGAFRISGDGPNPFGEDNCDE